MNYFTTLVVTVLLFSLLGCSTENPLCTDNYCVEGEIYPRSSLADDTLFSQLAVDDAAILAAFAGATPATPIETTPVERTPGSAETDLMDIINDVAQNGEDSDYNGQTVTVTATVVFKSEDGTGITLYKNASIIESTDEPVIFFVISLDDPVPLAGYSVGNTYTLTLFIRAILEPNETRDSYTIGAELAE